MITLDHPVVSSLLPVVLLIVVGLVTGKAKLIRQEAVRDLSNLVFLVLTQALLFRTMSSVHVQDLDFQPVSLYFAVAAGLFTALLLVQGASSRAAEISAPRLAEPTTNAIKRTYAIEGRAGSGALAAGVSRSVPVAVT